MAKSLQEISDRLELNDLLVDYTTAIDNKDIDALDHIFTQDAYIDYTAYGGIKGNFEEIKEFLQSALPLFSATQHLIANSSIKLNGDTATGKTMCFNPMVMKKEDGGEDMMILGFWYVDKFIRTENGWRIKERIEEAGYSRNI